MPNAAALQRGTEVAQSILEAHQERNGGALPETVAVNLWGLDAIKTKVGGCPFVALAAGMLLRCYRKFAGCVGSHSHSTADDLPPCATEMWTCLQGESVAIVLHLVGAKPIREGTGRYVKTLCQNLSVPCVCIYCCYDNRQTH